jgi:glycosyltransferase involved in cell wall biosynthesis
MSAAGLAELVGPAPTADDRVTVIVACYNQAEFVEATVRAAVEQQADFPFRVVVHDDASTDGTRDILRRLAAEYPERIHLVLFHQNQFSRGRSCSQRQLLDLVTPYVAFCEGDDVWTDPGKLQRQADFMDANPWCSLSHHEVEIWNAGGSPAYADELRAHLDGLNPRAERTPSALLSRGNFVMWCTTMLRTAAIPADLLRHVDSSLQPEDYVIVSAVAQWGDIGFLPEPMARYRVHGDSFWATKTPAERAAAELDVLWFLAVHLSGEIQDGFARRLLGTLHEAPADASLGPLLRVHDEVSSMSSRIADLEQRLTTAEAGLAEVLRRLHDVLGQWDARRHDERRAH